MQDPQQVVEPQAEATEQTEDAQAQPVRWEDLDLDGKVEQLAAALISTRNQMVPDDKVTVLPATLRVVVEPMDEQGFPGGKAVTFVDPVRNESHIVRFLSREAVDSFVANLTDQPSKLVIAGAGALSALEKKAAARRG